MTEYEYAYRGFEKTFTTCLLAPYVYMPKFLPTTPQDDPIAYSGEHSPNGAREISE